MVADALAFEDAGPDVLGALGDDPDAAQYLLRALIFRTVTDHLARPLDRRPEAEDRFVRPVDLAVAAASRAAQRFGDQR